MTSRELRQQAAPLVDKARALQVDADAAERAWSDEDEANFKKYMVDSRALSDQADALDGKAKRLSDLDERAAELDTSTGLISAPEIPDDKLTKGEKRSQADIASRMFSFRLLHGDPDARRELGHAWPIEHLTEYRALQADIDVSGGFAMPGAAFHSKLIKAVDDAVLMRSLGTRIDLQGAERVEGVSLDADPEDRPGPQRLATRTRTPRWHSADGRCSPPSCRSS